MHNHFNIDVATQLVNKIFNSIRCAVCDTTSGGRLRHPCGHTICSACADTVTSCLHCLTPPSSPAPVTEDATLTQLVKNVCELKQAFEDTYHVNVAIQSRISDQRKLEKELFPQCVQTPTVTYHNKRKAATMSHSSLSRLSALPGEVLGGRTPKADKQTSYVQDWLEQHNEDLVKYHPRTPFADIPINSPIHKSTPIKNNNSSFLKENASRAYRKRSHFKTDLKQNLNTSAKDVSLWKTAKRLKQETVSRKCNDESGIVIDDDTIVIEDSQNDVLDKDRQACLAVLEADKVAVTTILTQQSIEGYNEVKKNKPKAEKHNFSPNVLTWLNSETEPDIEEQPDAKNRKIPFYKKSVLLDPCSRCHNDSLTSKENNVSIRIETNNIITTVTVTNTHEMKAVPGKVSKGTQTDIIPENVTDNLSQEAKRVDERNKGIVVKESHTVICESSDSEQEMSGSFLVKALVHRSIDDVKSGVLTELRGWEGRALRGRRGPTPASSDSSDKENRDPNRIKNRVVKKKKKFRH